MVYLIVIAVVLIGVIYNGRMAKSLRLFWLIVIWLVQTLITGLRYRVGMDTLNYMESFNSFPLIQNFTLHDIFYFRYEPLYLLLNIYCKSYLGGFWWVQLICSGLTNACILIFLNKYCKNPFVGVLIYLYIAWLYFSTEIMRESIAIGIFLLNYKNLKNGSWFRYYAISFISIGFHYSAIITWFFPFVKYIRFNRLFVLLIIGSMLITPVVDSLNSMVNLGTISDRMNFYLDGNNLNFNYRIGLIIQNLLPGAFAYYLLNKKQCSIPFQQFFLLQVLFCFGAFAIPVVFQRFINYTQLFTIVMMSYAFWNRNISYHSKCILFAIIFISQSQYYYISKNRWIPYVSILNPYKVPAREYMWEHQF